METKSKGLLIALMVVAGTGMAPRAHAEGGGESREPAGFSMSGPPGAQMPAAGGEPGLAVSSMAPPTGEYERYWRQGLAIDAASVALMVSALAISEHTHGDDVPELLGVSGMVGYFLGNAALHTVHQGDPGRGMLSLLLRVGVPAAGFYVGGGIGAAHCQPSSSVDAPNLCPLIDAFIGAAVGVGTAMIIDYAWLARKRVERVPARGLSIMPSMSASPDAFTFGLSGRF